MSTKTNRLLTIFWLIFVVVLHLLPSSGIPKVSWIDQYHGDKLIHFLMFLPLGYGLVKAFNLKGIYVLFLTASLAGFLEIIQGTIFVGRSTDILDFCADITGIIIGIVIFNSK